MRPPGLNVAARYSTIAFRSSAVTSGSSCSISITFSSHSRAPTACRQARSATWQRLQTLSYVALPGPSGSCPGVARWLAGTAPVTVNESANKAAAPSRSTTGGTATTDRAQREDTRGQAAVGPAGVRASNRNHATRNCTLCPQLGDQLPARARGSLVPAVVQIRRLEVIEPKQVEDRRVDVPDVIRVLFRAQAELVGRCRSYWPPFTPPPAMHIVKPHGL